MADGTPTTTPVPAPARPNRWTTTESAKLRASFPTGGIAAARAALPHRSDLALRAQASRLGLRSPISPKDPARAAYIERLRAAIREVYDRGLKWGDIKALCERFDCNRMLIYQHMLRMGLQPVQLKAKPWTPAELELLEETAHLGINAAERRFRKSGFKRSRAAIMVQRTRNDVSAQTAKDDHGLRTTGALGTLLGVTDATIRGWLRMGLKAERRGTAEGCHYLIRDADLRRWIVDHPLRVNLNRIPEASRPWFVTMLAGL
jgi:hypothetical protein